MEKQQTRTATDIYRDFGKLVDELAALKTPPGHILNNLEREARLPQGSCAFYIGQAVANRNLPPMPDFRFPEEKPRRISILPRLLSFGKFPR